MGDVKEREKGKADIAFAFNTFHRTGTEPDPYLLGGAIRAGSDVPLLRGIDIHVIEKPESAKTQREYILRPAVSSVVHPALNWRIITQVA